MNFYSALQFGPEVLIKYIKNAETNKEKSFYIAALIIRDLLIVAFAIIFVSSLSAIFGSENSPMAIVIFCIMLSSRFVDFNYNIKNSLLSLFILFTILLVSPQLIQIYPAYIGLIINLISIFTIMLLACEKPEMGNAGLYLFSYVFLTGSRINFNVFIKRSELTILGFIICAIIFFYKHKHKHKERSYYHILKDFNLKSTKNRWQIEITIALSLLFLLGSFFNIERFMWVGFACSSLLSSYPINLKDRLINRGLGIFIGSLLFGILYAITPTKFTFLFGPISGLCLGLCPSYKSKTIFNCFGALLMASSIYGIHDAIIIRIANNCIGLIFGYIFFNILELIFNKFLKNNIK